jgi:hypothetical protein
VAEQFKRAEEGSLVLYISKESPGPELEPSWLPISRIDEELDIVMPIYAPDSEKNENLERTRDLCCASYKEINRRINYEKSSHKQQKNFVCRNGSVLADFFFDSSRSG